VKKSLFHKLFNNRDLRAIGQTWSQLFRRFVNLLKLWRSGKACWIFGKNTITYKKLRKGVWETEN